MVAESQQTGAIFRTNHGSNYPPVKGRRPRDRNRIVVTADAALRVQIPLRPEYYRAPRAVRTGNKLGGITVADASSSTPDIRHLVPEGSPFTTQPCTRCPSGHSGVDGIGTSSSQVSRLSPLTLRSRA